MLTLATTLGFTVIVTVFEVAGDPDKQGVAFDVITQVTVLPLASELLEYVGLFEPTFEPFNFHWYTGVVPPFVGVAVNVTFAPAHIFVALALIFMLAGKFGFTVTVVALKLLITVLQPEPDDRLVIVTVVAPIFKEDVVNVPVPGVPALKVIVAVSPVAVVEPDKLYVTLKVPEGNEADLNVITEVEAPQNGPLLVADAVKAYTGHVQVRIT